MSLNSLGLPQMPQIVTFNSLQPGLLDACAAVKLVVTEDGSDRLLKTFSGGSFFITSFCLFEALGVLKRNGLGIRSSAITITTYSAASHYSTT